MGGKLSFSKLCPNCIKSLYNHQRRSGAQKRRGTFAYIATPYCDFTRFQYSFSAEGACQKFKKWRARARVFFQDCVILPGALQRLVYLKRSVFAREDATRSTRSKRNTQRAAHATRTRNTQHATRNTQEPSNIAISRAGTSVASS